MDGNAHALDLRVRIRIQVEAEGFAGPVHCLPGAVVRDERDLDLAVVRQVGRQFQRDGIRMNDQIHLVSGVRSGQLRIAPRTRSIGRGLRRQGGHVFLEQHLR